MIIKNAVDYYLDGSIPYYEVGAALGIRGDMSDEDLQALADERETDEVKTENGDRILWEPRSFVSLCVQVRKHVRSQERTWINILGTWVRLIERDHNVKVKDRIQHVKRFGHWDRMVEHFGYKKAREILEAIEPMTDREKRKARIVFHLCALTGGDTAAASGIVETLFRVLENGATMYDVVKALTEMEKGIDNVRTIEN